MLLKTFLSGAFSFEQARTEGLAGLQRKSSICFQIKTSKMQPCGWPDLLNGNFVEIEAFHSVGALLLASTILNSTFVCITRSILPHFLKLIIIRQVKTKKIATVTVVWI